MKNSERAVIGSKTVADIVSALGEENRIQYDIGGRGGTYGAPADYVVEALFPTLEQEKINEIVNMLPNKVGVHCNYLGGGLRGALVRSDYDKALPAKYAKRIDAFTRECKARYLAIENDGGLNDETYPDGDTNWEALGTNASRRAGVESGY